MIDDMTKAGVIVTAGERPSVEPAKVPVPNPLEIAARRKASAVVAKQRKLIANLRGDLERHGDPEQWKRYGDLLLANIGNATRRDGEILVTDYFDEATPIVTIEGDVNRSISEIAEGYFRLYTKARNGLRVIGERMAIAESALEIAIEKLSQIDAAIEAGDTEFFERLSGPKLKPQMLGRKKKVEAAFKGARRFVSADGFEIMVGKKSSDNDYLTFRIAKSLDTWLHAADYPGSHVVIRNPNRKEISSKTLTEAAQLAAFYSDARELPKAAVNYTLKKFVNKPKRSAPGLVSLASFKTILVEPQVSVKKVDNS